MIGSLESTASPRHAGGSTCLLRAGEDLQSALDTASPGDVISVPPGAAFPTFTRLNKSGVDWITVRSSTPDSCLTPPATQAAPIHSGGMPKLEPAVPPVITAVPGAHHSWFIGIKIRPRPGAFLYRTVSSQVARVSSLDFHGRESP